MSKTHNPYALSEALKVNKIENINISIIDSQKLSLFDLNNLLEAKNKPVEIVLSNLFDNKTYSEFKLWCQGQTAEKVFLISYIQQNGCLVVNDPGK